jgi:hypothetical protein
MDLFNDLSLPKGYLVFWMNCFNVFNIFSLLDELNQSNSVKNETVNMEKTMNSNKRPISEVDDKEHLKLRLVDGKKQRRS